MAERKLSATDKLCAILVLSSKSLEEENPSKILSLTVSEECLQRAFQMFVDKYDILNDFTYISYNRPKPHCDTLGNAMRNLIERYRIVRDYTQDPKILLITERAEMDYRSLEQNLNDNDLNQLESASRDFISELKKEKRAA